MQNTQTTSQALKRTLHTRHLSMIAIGGSIGTFEVLFITRLFFNLLEILIPIDQAGHSNNESGILTLAYNRQDIDTTGLIIHFIKNVLSK